MRKHKYSAVATEVDGIMFQSKAEARRYSELRLLERAGEIKELYLQPKYPLLAPVAGRTTKLERVGEYRANFCYREGPQGLLVIEDVKGVRTEMFKWKKRHFEIQYGLSITEITSRRSVKRAH